MLHTPIFNNEEQSILNRIDSLDDMSKQKFIEDEIGFLLATCNNDEIIDLLEGLRDKVSNLTDKEWDELQLLLPFDIAYDSDESDDYIFDE